MNLGRVYDEDDVNWVRIMSALRRCVDTHFRKPSGVAHRPYETENSVIGDILPIIAAGRTTSQDPDPTINPHALQQSPSDNLLRSQIPAQIDVDVGDKIVTVDAVVDMDGALDFISRTFIDANGLEMDVADYYPHPDALGSVKVRFSFGRGRRMQIRRLLAVRNLAYSIILAGSAGGSGELTAPNLSSHQMISASKDPEADRRPLHLSVDGEDSHLLHPARHVTEQASDHIDLASTSEGDIVPHIEQLSLPLLRDNFHPAKTPVSHDSVDSTSKRHAETISVSGGRDLEPYYESQSLSLREPKRTPGRDMSLLSDIVPRSPEKILQTGGGATDAIAKWSPANTLGTVASVLAGGSLGIQIQNASTARRALGVSKSALDRSTELAAASGKSVLTADQSLQLNRDIFAYNKQKDAAANKRRMDLGGSSGGSSTFSPLEDLKAHASSGYSPDSSSSSEPPPRLDTRRKRRRHRDATTSHATPTASESSHGSTAPRNDEKDSLSEQSMPEIPRSVYESLRGTINDSEVPRILVKSAYLNDGTARDQKACKRNLDEQNDHLPQNTKGKERIIHDSPEDLPLPRSVPQSVTEVDISKVGREKNQVEPVSDYEQDSAVNGLRNRSPQRQNLIQSQRTLQDYGFTRTVSRPPETPKAVRQDDLAHSPVPSLRKLRSLDMKEENQLDLYSRFQGLRSAQPRFLTQADDTNINHSRERSSHNDAKDSENDTIVVHPVSSPSSNEKAGDESSRFAESSGAIEMDVFLENHTVLSHQ